MSGSQDAAWSASGEVPGQRSDSERVSATLPAGRRVSGEPVVDARVLTTLVSTLGDEAFVRETVNLYLAELDSRLSAMRGAAERGAPEDLARAAHTLKSASALLGAERMASYCRRVEECARRGEVDDDDIGRAGGEVVVLREALPRFFTDSAPAPDGWRSSSTMEA